MACSGLDLRLNINDRCPEKLASMYDVCLGKLSESA